METEKQFGANWSLSARFSIYLQYPLFMLLKVHTANRGQCRRIPCAIHPWQHRWRRQRRGWIRFVARLVTAAVTSGVAAAIGMMLWGTTTTMGSSITSSPSLTTSAAASGTTFPHGKDADNMPTLRCSCVMIGWSVLRRPQGLNTILLRTMKCQPHCQVGQVPHYFSFWQPSSQIARFNFGVRLFPRSG